ncbi:MAG TPA: hypothetical protein VF261_01015, partial [Candidatus Saccharimonadales bacterium]
DEPLSSVVDRYESQTSYGALKTAVAAAVVQLLQRFQAGLARVNTEELMQKLQKDEARMNEIANATLAKVQKAVGLRQ